MTENGFTINRKWIEQLVESKATPSKWFLIYLMLKIEFGDSPNINIEDKQNFCDQWSFEYFPTGSDKPKLFTITTDELDSAIIKLEQVKLVTANKPSSIQLRLHF